MRSFVSVQGSLAMFPIWAFGSEEQKQQWLPGMAAGELIGCFGLTEPDSGSDPGSMRTTARRDPSGDWMLDGAKMWITNGSLADVAVVWARTDPDGPDGGKVRGFVVPTDTPGFSAPEIHRKVSLRASVTSELVLDSVRLPADAVLPGVVRHARSAELPQRGPVRHRLRCLRRGEGLLRGRARLRRRAGPVRPADRLVPAHPAQAGGDDGRRCRRARWWRCTWAA